MAPTRDFERASTWVNLSDAVELCDRFHLTGELQPVIKVGQDPDALQHVLVTLARDTRVQPSHKIQEIVANGVVVPVFVNWRLVNIRRIFKAAGDGNFSMHTLRENNPTVVFTTMYNPEHGGTFADLGFGRRVCEHFGLWKLAQQLAELQPLEDQNTYRYITASLPNRTYPPVCVVKDNIVVCKKASGIGLNNGKTRGSGPK